MAKMNMREKQRDSGLIYVWLYNTYVILYILYCAKYVIYNLCIEYLCDYSSFVQTECCINFGYSNKLDIIWSCPFCVQDETTLYKTSNGHKIVL